MTDDRTEAYRVRGRVQGVGFRWSASARARELGLAGSVQNEAAGTVLVVMRGTADAVSAMRRWLDGGPPAARVSAVEPVSVPDGLEPDWGTPFQVLR